MNSKLLLPVLALALLAGCSKTETEHATAQSAAPTSTGGTIVLHGIYTMQMTGAAYLITDLENVSKDKVMAFQGTWTITDDLDAKVADETIKYTSDTIFLDPAGAKQAHVIAPGERFMMIDQAVQGQEDKTFCSPTNLAACGVLPITTALASSKLDDYKVSKKINWEVEKVVAP